MSATISQRKVRVAVIEEKLQVAMNMIGANANANEVALAVGISTKAAYRLMQRINDCTQNDINLLNATKKYGPKVTPVITESTRTVIEVIQQDCTVTHKGVVQKLNDMGVIITQTNVSLILKRMK